MNEIVKPGNDSKQMNANDSAVEYETYEQMSIGKQIDGILGDAIDCVKDDRAATNRAITSDIASGKTVQKQNNQLMNAYESELQRDDLTREQRDDILNKMRETAASTSRVDIESRKFQTEQLSYSHKRSGQLMVLGVAIALSAGVTALFLNQRA